VKVAINFRNQGGPRGGGNRFADSLAAALQERDDTVCHTLRDPDIDIILLLDPRWRHPSVTFTPGAILRYMLFRNPRTLVVHRINECDERKKTRKMNALLWRANYCADHTVFVGSWLQSLEVWQKNRESPTSVITNGADAKIFNSQGWSPWNYQGPIKFVTHHWGGNWMKGFDIYQRLDQMLQKNKWKERIDFTYIGNLPQGFSFRNTRYVPPIDGKALARELRSHHAYITASINEPGGNHQNEGALCGLPILYRRSGCLPEYCEGFGEEFDEDNFEIKLETFISKYQTFCKSMPQYPHISTVTNNKYLKLFDQLQTKKKYILAKRNLWKNPWLIMRNQLPI